MKNSWEAVAQRWSVSSGKQRHGNCTALSLVAIDHFEELVVVQRLVLRDAITVSALDAVLFLHKQNKWRCFETKNNTWSVARNNATTTNAHTRK